MKTQVVVLWGEGPIWAERLQYQSRKQQRRWEVRTAIYTVLPAHSDYGIVPRTVRGLLGGLCSAILADI